VAVLLLLVVVELVAVLLLVLLLLLLLLAQSCWSALAYLVSVAANVPLPEVVCCAASCFASAGCVAIPAWRT
jgi:hypothetical protein